MNPHFWIAKTEGSHVPAPHRVLDLRVVIGLIGLLYILGAVLSQRRAFDPDEFMHSHFAWAIFKGMVPYRDYFDHYTPLYHLFLAPFLHFFNVETDARDSVAFLFFARKLAWLTSGMVLLLTFWLCRLWRNKQVGFVAVLLLLITEAYWNMTLEIRPDTFATVFWLLFLIIALRAVRGGQRNSTRRKMFLWSGVILALGFLASQKYIYAYPGLAVAISWYVWRPSNRSSLQDRLVHVMYQFMGFCIPMTLTAAYFYFQNGLTEFIRYNFVFYLGVAGSSPFQILHQFVYQQPFLVFLGGAGLLRSLLSIFNKSLPRRGDFLIVPTTLSLIAGLFIIPTPNYQYYVLFLPQLAALASAFLLDSVVGLAVLRERMAARRWIYLAALSGAVPLCGLLVITRGAGSQWPLIVIIGYWFVALISCMALMFRRRPAAALILFFFAMILSPLLRLRSEITSTQATPQIEEMRYIVENTTPNETVMDGYQGSGVFRPHAYFFWFLAFNERSGISEKEKQKLLENLQSGSISPQLILFDVHLHEFYPAVTEFLERNYQPVGIGVIWKRKRTS